MPHLTLEYTRNLDLDPEAALRNLNEEMYASGLFAEADIKSRAVALDHWRVGIADVPRAFAHVRVALLAGRPPEVRRALAERLLVALRANCGAPDAREVQLCVETLEIDGPSYAKTAFAVD